jgi:hypothetical protein
VKCRDVRSREQILVKKGEQESCEEVSKGIQVEEMQLELSVESDQDSSLRKLVQLTREVVVFEEITLERRKGKLNACLSCGWRLRELFLGREGRARGQRERNLLYIHCPRLNQSSDKRLSKPTT